MSRNRIKFVVDRSGSMSGHERETFDAFDAFIRKLRDERVEADCDLWLFDTDTTLAYRGRPVSEADIRAHYQIAGGTHLWDAVGKCIEGPVTASGPTNIHLQRLGVVRNSAKQIGPGEHTVVVVITDGRDTGSPQYSEAQIRSMATTREATGHWTFVWISIGALAAQPTWATNLITTDFAKLLAAMKELAERTVRLLKSGDEVIVL